MDLLRDSDSLHSVGSSRNVSGKTIFYDLSFGNCWWIPAGDYVPTHTLRQQEIFAERNPTATLAPNWPHPLCGLLRNFRHTNGDPKGNCALHTAVINEMIENDSVKKIT